jgi:hypothetical protein
MNNWPWAGDSSLLRPNSIARSTPRNSGCSSSPRPRACSKRRAAAAHQRCQGVGARSCPSNRPRVRRNDTPALRRYASNPSAPRGSNEANTPTARTWAERTISGRSGAGRREKCTRCPTVSATTGGAATIRASPERVARPSTAGNIRSIRSTTSASRGGNRSHSGRRRSRPCIHNTPPTTPATTIPTIHPTDGRFRRCIQPAIPTSTSANAAHTHVRSTGSSQRPHTSPATNGNSTHNNGARCPKLRMRGALMARFPRGSLPGARTDLSPDQPATRPGAATPCAMNRRPPTAKGRSNPARR